MSALTRHLSAGKAAGPVIAHRLVTSPHPRALVDPTTKRIAHTVHDATDAHVKDAVRGARDAQPEWQRYPSRRRDALLTLADHIARERIDYMALEMAQTGKPEADAAGEVDETIETLRYYGGWADKQQGTHVWRDGLQTATVCEPYGVVGLITSFNYPLMLAGWKLGPALAAGNTVLLKPAPQTPLTSLALGLSKALPEGVLQVLPGGADVGRGILHAVDRASFTGSTHVGQHILRDSADRLLPLTLECGGKNAVVVLPDADLDLAADNITMGAFSNAGQNCCAVARVLVHRDVHDSLCDAIRDRLQTWRPATKAPAAALSASSSLASSSVYGPLIDQAQYDRVMQYRSHRAPDMSADDDALDAGFFVPPSVYTHVEDTDPLATEEIFGPILSVLTPFSHVEDAVRRANALPYGLAAGVFSRSYPAAAQVAHRLRTGYVWINTYNVMPPYAPFGGRGLSGVGKDLGQAALDEFTFTKTVVTHL